MGAVTLKLRCPSSVNGIAADPQPDWSFDQLLLELKKIESTLNVSPIFAKTYSREYPALKDGGKSQKAFVMRVSDNEMDEMEDGDDKEGDGKGLPVGRRFACPELYLSDSDEGSEYSDDESIEEQSLMDKGGIVESALIELSHEHHQSVTDDIRSQVAALETDLLKENEKFTSALSRVEKDAECRRELHRKLDLQYQRRIAEALDSHLTDVQRHHEYKFQIEEKKIRDDAAVEDAKRRQKAYQEEKARQEKLKAEEARLEAQKKRDEEAKAAALEAKRAAKQAAEIVATDALRKASEATTSRGSGSDGPKKEPTGKNILKGAETALKLEEGRMQIYKEVAAKNDSLGTGSKKEFRSHGAEIARRMKTISGTNENVRTRAGDFVKLLNSSYPQSISVAMFTEKIVSQVANPSGSFSKTLYAYGHVIVMVTSQVPLAMDLLLAELNRVCIYTVPKHINYSKSLFNSKEDYFKAVGYRDEDGQLESTDSFLQRLTSYMRLYGALVQTEVPGYQNLHGMKEGWAWLARFLNALPANLYTAVALQAFLEVAGFALHRTYKSQFKKLLNLISSSFITELKGDHPRLAMAVASLQDYIKSNKFLEEPEGWRLQNSTLSQEFVPNPESDSREQYQYSSGYQDQYQYPSSGYQNQNQYSSNRFTYRR